MQLIRGKMPKTFSHFRANPQWQVQWSVWAFPDPRSLLCHHHVPQSWQEQLNERLNSWTAEVHRPGITASQHQLHWFPVWILLRFSDNGQKLFIFSLEQLLSKLLESSGSWEEFQIPLRNMRRTEWTNLSCRSVKVKGINQCLIMVWWVIWNQFISSKKLLLVYNWQKS